MDHNTLRRLAFIRYLYLTAVRQSLAPPPLSCASVLTMHDAVELFLELCSEYLNIGKEQPKFIDYWELPGKKLGRELEQKESMRRLNKARVALKHHGNLLSEMDVEAFRGSVTNFFSDNTQIVFGIEFTEISLIQYVNPESARNRLKEAEQDITSGEILSALDKIAVSFAEMIDDYETRKHDRFSRSPFHFGRRLDSIHGSSISLGDDSLSASRSEKKLRDFVDRVKESLEAMQEAIKILALAIDYRKYSKFRQLTPILIRAGNDYILRRRLGEKDQPSIQDTRFCLEFVVESSLALVEFDYTIASGRDL